MRLLELRDRLEERGWGEEAVEREVSRERKETMERWKRAEEEEKRMVLREKEAEEANNEKKGDEKEDGEEKEQGEEKTEIVRRKPSREHYNRRDYRQGGRYRDHRYSDQRRGGRGGKNAQQQQIFQEERNERLRDAFGISERTHKEGSCSSCDMHLFIYILIYLTIIKNNRGSIRS